MIKTLHGIVHGKTIELIEDLDQADGQEVEVTVRTVPPNRTQRSGVGFLRTEGALVDDPEWDSIMDEIYQSRKVDRRPQSPQLEEG